MSKEIMNDNHDLAVKKVEKIPANSTNNKALYIVVTDDPTVKTKHRLYVARQLNMQPLAVEIAGFEVPLNIIAQLNDTTSFEDAVELARKGSNSEQENLFLPWQRIIRIKRINKSA